MSNLGDTVNHVKTELMPDFDYELYEKRQLEWEEKIRLEDEQAKAASQSTEAAQPTENTEPPKTEPDADTDGDISW